METKLKFKYDREADILYIDKRPPYPEQTSEEIGDEIVARLNPDTGEIENLEVLFFSTRLLRNELFELPVTADLRLSRENRTKTNNSSCAPKPAHNSSLNLTGAFVNCVARSGRGLGP